MNTHSIRFRLTVWYAGLLVGLLLLFGAAVYFGLARYLEWTLRESLSDQAKQIGAEHLFDVAVSGEEYVIDEINEHFAPEINDRYVRLTRADGNVLYASGPPEDKSFDPSSLPVLGMPDQREFYREEHLRDGGELLIYTMPFTTRDGNRFLIEVGASYGQIEGILRGLLLSLGVGLPVVMAMAIGGGYWLMRKALKPIDETTHSAERISSRSLSERLPIAHTGDEIERLSLALNRMIARLDEAFQQLRRFSADASHELRTPLTILRGELEAIAGRSQLEDELQETISSALEETERLTKIVESLLTISRLDAGEARMERVRVDLAHLTAMTTEQMRLLADDKNIWLRFGTHEKIEVEGDPARLKQVVVNLVDNAIKYTPEGGEVSVSVSRKNGAAVLEVVDNGVGIPKEFQPHLFERFYRVDKARSRAAGGVGLGLAIVKSICAAHGGEIEVESEEGKGTRFWVELPLANGTTGEERLRKG